MKCFGLETIHPFELQNTRDALAAVAVSSAAFAQVTISGNLNINAMSNAKSVVSTAPAAANIEGKTVGTGNTEGWTASQIAISGSEEIMPGVTASFTVNQRLNNAHPDSVMGGRDTNIALTAGFGTVRIGRFIPAAASGFHGYTGARTTNQAGSLYGALLGAGSLEMGTANGTTTTVSGGSFERQPSVIQYTSPAFMGVTLNASYAKNGADRNDADRAGNGNTTQTGISLTYAAGPMSVAAGFNNRKENREAAPASAASTLISVGGVGVVTNAIGQREIDADLNWVGASYDLGVAKISAAHIIRKGETATAGAAAVVDTDISTNAFGVSVPMGAITLAASAYNGKNAGAVATTDDLKLSGYQISATYSLSKRTTVYAAMGENKSKRDGDNVGITVKSTSSAVGLMHSF